MKSDKKDAKMKSNRYSFAIYQLRREMPENNGLFFQDSGVWAKKMAEINERHYSRVYSAALTQEQIDKQDYLDEIFHNFNVNRPSLSRACNDEFDGEPDYPISKPFKIER